MTREQMALVNHMLRALQTPSKDLTAWETSFLESLADQWPRRGSLTDTQFEKLEQLYAEKTS